MATKAQRTHMHHVMDFFYAHRAHVTYPPHDHRSGLDQVAFRMTEQEMEHHLAGGGLFQADCSEMVAEVCRYCGLRDPGATGYRYAGWTGSFLSNERMPHYTEAARAGIGALVVFGPGTGDHVSMVYTPGKDPLLQSHGRPGMDRLRLSEERKWHRAPVTFLSIAHL